jgi:ATP-dependent Clp protease ATP-binding subunit ClpC
MFERFTEKALRVILLAQEEARKTGHNFVGTEQLLLGLIDEGTGIGSQALKAGGLKLADAKREVERLIGKGSGFVAVEIPFTPRAKSILEQSLEQAKGFNHSYIGTEHILLALLEDTEGIAKQILKKLKVDLYKVRRVLLKEIGQIVDPVGLEMKKKEDEIEKKVKEMMEQDRRNKTDKKKKLAEQRKERFKEFRNKLKDIQGQEGFEFPTNRFDFKFNFDFDYNNFYAEDDDDDDEIRTIVEKRKGESQENDSGDFSGLFSKDLEELFKKKLEEPSIETPTLKEFTSNLSILAFEGKIDPVIGRQKEVERVIQILSRRRKNNPILIGEPGVGKTAVAEGLALKIYNQEVAACLADKEVAVLDVGSLLAGTKYRGEFEERLKRIMNELKMKKNIILVIDEVHTIVGAGAAEGSLDAANILKPALARGELQCIGATTLDEYKQIEKDPALERRFQSVFVAEPTKEECFQILKGLRATYENYHHVRIPNCTLKASIQMSALYIKDRFLPDKAIDLVDEAASRVKLSSLLGMKGFASSMEQDLIRVLEEKDFVLRSQNFELAAELRDKEMLLRTQLRGFLNAVKAPQELIENRETLPLVGIEEINDVISSWTGIPLNKIGKDEAKKLLNMEKEMHNRVIGQHKAVTSICSAIQRARVGMRNPNRPIASFLFCGPTGVGKTELTKTLAANFFGSESAMVRFDMSEFMERHTVAKLIGSPPGYIGYNEGGQLTEAVRRKPFSLILFDEVEKAHPDIFNLLLQVLDDGRLTDSKGKVVDFTNTIIIMTSNLGSKHIDNKLGQNKKQAKNENNYSLGDRIEKEKLISEEIFDIDSNENSSDFNYKELEFDVMEMNFQKSIEDRDEKNRYEEESNRIEELVKTEIKSFFRPEFINRIDEIIIFERLKKDEVAEICDLMLKEIHNRLLEQNMFLYVDESAKKYLVDEGYDPLYGARPIRRAITNHLESKVTLSILKKQVVTLRSIILVEYDNYRKIHSSLYPLPSFVLSPFNKDIINSEENEKAILSYIGVLKSWKKEAILPQKYLIHYYEDSDMYEETEQKEQQLVKRAKEEIMNKVEKLMIENESKNLDNEGLDKEPKILIGDKKNLDD